MKLLGISGTIVGSKTEVAVKKTLEYVDDDITTEFINLKDYDLEFCDGRPISEYNKDTQDLIGKICVADAYIFGTPIFQGSLTGVLKNLFDLIPPKALRRKVVGLIATGEHFNTT
jgi:FAD reductase [NAD(P)H]